MNIPKIRFKEFRNEWHSCKIDDFCKILMCKRIFANETSQDYEIPFYKIGTIGGTPDTFISKKLFDIYKIKYNYPKKGELLVTCSGTVGKCIIFDGKDSYYQDSNIVWLDNPTLKVSNRFLYYLLSRVDWSKLNSTTITRIYSNDLKQLKINYPEKEEQNKITNLLELLDKKIELQTKKIEALKLFKSSQICTTLNKLEHKNVLLKNLGYFISGNPIGKDKITDKGTPVILYGDLYTKYEEEINDVNQYVKENKKYIKSEKGDLIFPTSTTVDAISLISPSVINISDVVYGGDLIVFKVNEAIVNPKFLSYQINHLKKKEFSKKAQGSTIIHIHADDLLNSTVEIPIMKYQNIISNFGSEINKKIELEKNKLDKLKLLKIGLLQNMFI